MKHIFQTTVVGFIILTCASCSLLSAGMREPSDMKEVEASQIVLCRGLIFFTGNEPNISLMIRSEGDNEQPSREYTLYGSAIMFLKAYQQEAMIIVGTIKSQKLGPGFPPVVEVIAYQDSTGTWFDAQGTLLEIPENIMTDDQIRRYFSSNTLSL